MKERVNFTKIDLLMITIMLIWGLNLSLIKYSLIEMNPLSFNGIRLILASFSLLFFTYIFEKNLKVQKEDFIKIIFIGVVSHTVYQFVFINGINKTTASNTSIILATSPIFVSLLSSFYKHEKTHWLGWIGIFVSFFGVYLIILGKSGGFKISSSYFKGDVLILLASILWSYYTVSCRPLLKRYSPLKLTAITMGIGTLFFIPVSMKDMRNIHWQSISLKAYGGLLYSTFLAIVFAFVIWYYSVQKVGNSRTAIYSYLQPVFAVIFAFLLLSERLTLIQFLGALIIFIGIYLAKVGYNSLGT
ncbi:MAG: DMT family transporter [Acidobacteriota bacterium]